MSADRVALTSSTSEAYALLFKLLCDAGDQVLVPHPSYPLFEHLTRLEVGDARCRTRSSITARGASTSTRSTRGHHRSRARDPGRVAEQPDRIVPAPRRSRRRCRDLPPRTICALIGDEVFADYPLDPAPAATPVLAGADVLTFSLGGLSKSAGLPQLKLGWIGFGGPSAKVDEALAAYEIIADTYLSVSTPVQVAAAAS